jgi:hypothetical protein
MASINFGYQIRGEMNKCQSSFDHRGSALVNLKMVGQGLVGVQAKQQVPLEL